MADYEDSREIEKLRRDKIKAEKKNNFKEEAQICNYLGELLAKRGKFEEAIQEHEIELALSETLNDTIGCAVACRKIGECYCGLEQYDKALYLQQRHLSLAQSCESKVEEQRALATIGRTHLLQSETSKKKEVIESALKKAEKAFMKSLEVCEKLKISNVELMEMKARLYLNLGLVFDSRGNMNQCAEFMKRAISISEQHNLHSDLYRCQVSIASMYHRGGNLSQAQQYLVAAHRCAVKLKDKLLENEVLMQKAAILLEQEDCSSSKHALKKAYKLGMVDGEDREKMLKYFRAVTKIEDMLCSLKEMQDGALEQKYKLFEKLGDKFAEVGIYRQSIEYYKKMLRYAAHLKKSNKDLIPIYVSLAQTYADNKQYPFAVEFYKKEIECRGSDEEQKCRTWLNISECQEQAGMSYQITVESLLSAFDCARKAKHRRLQVHVLKVMVELQKSCNQNAHKEQTEAKLNHYREKYNVLDGEDLSEEEEDSQKSEEDEEGGLSIDELTESEDSSEEQEKRTTNTTVSCRIRRGVKAKRNEKGETPLHRACIEGNVKKVTRLITQGHPVNPRDFCGWIPLHEAANHDHVEIVAYLLEHGAAVNDRGGAKCGGVTPLIDAANCGNIEVMDVLIKKGAAVTAKDDEGNTALDCLREWRRRCDSIDDQTLSKYEDMIKKLQLYRHKDSDAVRKPFKRNSAVEEHLDNNSLERSDNLPSFSRPPKKHRNLRRTVSSDDSDRSDEEPPSRNRPLKQTLTGTDTGGVKASDRSATDTYREAISSVGLSARRRTGNVYTSCSVGDQGTSALVSEDTYVDEDWLIDDMQPMKRRRLDVDGVFSTNSIKTKNTDTRNNAGQDSEGSDIDCEVPSTSRRLPVQTNRIDSDSDDDCVIDGYVEPLPNLSQLEDNSLGLPTLSITSQRSSQQTQLRMTNFTVNQPDVLPSLSMESRSSQRSYNRQPKQTRLTNFTSNQTTNCLPNNSAINVNISQSLSRRASSPVYNRQPEQTSVMRIKVRVEDKLLLIPVQDSQKDIGWLAEEASVRYNNLCGVHPRLVLSTQDGAFLTPSDPISLVLSSGEELIGSVNNWMLPSQTVQYEQLCKNLNTACYSNIKNILEKCDGTGVLKLADLNLNVVDLLPVFKVIATQTSLHTLNLKGNRLDDHGLHLLMTTCPMLSNLKTLSLSFNPLTHIGIQHLANSLSKGVETFTTLRNLTSLDVSFNSIGDLCCQALVEVLGSLPFLTDLNLSWCSLSAKFFEESRNTLWRAVQKTSLQNLDISYNSLGAVGLELLMKSLPPEKLKRLSMAGIIKGKTNNSFVLEHLYKYLSKENCFLEELDLNYSNLTAEDVDDLVRLLGAGKNIRILKIAYNRNIKNKGIQRLLQQSVSEFPHLDYLHMEGCGMCSPLSSDFIDAVVDNLQGESPLKYLSFTCSNLDDTDAQSMRQVWSAQWQQEAEIQINGSLMRLGVKS